MSVHLEKKIDDLAVAVKRGFDHVGNQLEKVEGRLGAVEGRLGAVEGRLGTLEGRVDNLPDKAYLDDKMADLKGELIVKHRREDEKVEYVVSLLHERGVFTDADIERIQREFQLFPRLAAA